MSVDIFKFILNRRHVYSTVKYTDESRDSRKEKLDWNIRIQHDPYSLDLAPFDFAFFPQLKSDLHGKRFRDMYELLTESYLKRDMVLVISTENGFNDTGNT